MRIITKDDATDVYLRILQRGIPYVLSKLHPSGSARTKSAFNTTDLQSSNWWIIPSVKKRWNALITKNPSECYEHYVSRKYLRHQAGGQMLSIGSGVCSHELLFARYANFNKVVCVDIAEKQLEVAQAKAMKLGLDNMDFMVADIKKADFQPHSFDMVLFHSSLHHFSDIFEFLHDAILKWLKPGGWLIIHEYVGKNRLQYPTNQLAAINEGLSLIPDQLKVRLGTHLIKRKYTGSGILRMIAADPSECIESESILPSIHALFEIVEETALGGNLLMGILKDISHHFVDENDELAQKVLTQLFAFEDAYLHRHSSDFVFGIYRSPTS